MNTYSPRYYSQFKCIADRCKKSCCIGWEIDIDGITLEKYRSLDDVISTVDMTEVPYMRLCSDGRCPHLDASGLCRIINNYGEEYLSDICREHPRFYNYTSSGRYMGLGIVCEEAARIVLSSDDYDELLVYSNDSDEENKSLSDNTPLIKSLYSILSSRSVPYSERLESLYGEVGISPDINTDDYWRDVFSECELMDSSHKDLFSAYSSVIPEREEFECELERFLAYLIYRHVASASDDEKLASLGFAFTLERLLSSVIRKEKPNSRERVIELASDISLELEYSEDNTDSIKFEFEI